MQGRPQWSQTLVKEKSVKGGPVTQKSCLQAARVSMMLIKRMSGWMPRRRGSQATGHMRQPCVEIRIAVMSTRERSDMQQPLKDITSKMMMMMMILTRDLRMIQWLNSRRSCPLHLFEELRKITCLLPLGRGKRWHTLKNDPHLVTSPHSGHRRIPLRDLLQNHERAS